MRSLFLNIFIHILLLTGNITKVGHKRSDTGLQILENCPNVEGQDFQNRANSRENAAGHTEISIPPVSWWYPNFPSTGQTDREHRQKNGVNPERINQGDIQPLPKILSKFKEKFQD
jgi:hypothetical protein